MWGRRARNLHAKLQSVFNQWVYTARQSMAGEGEKVNGPIFPSFRVLFFVAVPLGSLNHFHEPTRSY
jgi:hypothetical protein